MNTKYEILMDKENSREITIGKGSHERKVIVHRIKALKDIGESVKAGDIGGFVESESNLTVDDSSWIFDNAVVCENALVDFSEIYGFAVISGNAVIVEDSVITDRVRIDKDVCVRNSKVNDDAYLTDSVSILDGSEIRDSVQLSGNVYVHNTKVCGCSKVMDRAVLTDSIIMENALVSGYCKIIESTVKDSAYVAGSAIVIKSVIKDKAEVKDAAMVTECIVKGDAVLLGRMYLCGNLTIHNSDQVFSLASFDPLYNKTNLGASAKFKGPTFVYTGKKIVVIDGQLITSLEEYVNWAAETFGEEFREEYEMVCTLAQLHFKNCNPFKNEEFSQNINKKSGVMMKATSFT